MAVLHRDYDEKKFHKELGSWEKDLVRYIDDGGSTDYSEILMQDSRWEIFYHLSPMRHSVLNWYEFGDDADILEIGGGFGAMTGLFCDRGRKVTSIENSIEYAQAIVSRHKMCTNLEVFVRDFRDLRLEDKYDYIVLVDVFETIFDGKPDLELYRSYLQYLCSFLKHDATILLAVSNRMGIKHFCGVQDDFATGSFAGLNHYPLGNWGYAFTRKELKDMIGGLEFGAKKFYYPLPDHKLTQAVYSEAYLPKGKICDRILPYYPDKSDLVVVEPDLYDEVIANGVFEVFVNSFLVECCIGAKQTGDIIYAAVSTDRGEEHGFATAIHNNDTVTKKSLSDKGQESLRETCRNIRELQNHGLKVVDHQLIGQEIKMPYMKEKSLLEFMHETICNSREKFLDLMDRIYQCILDSSEHVPVECNELPYVNDKPEGMDRGVVLRRAYIDMVHMNCFWMDGDICFFDQEFAKDNYPAKYIMFRNVMYYYIFNPEDEQYVSQEELKERYGLSGGWDAFLAEENKFVSQNRNWKLYQHYYGWTMYDKNEIYARGNHEIAAQPLSVSEEGMSGESVKPAYTVSKQLRDVQELEKYILHEFHVICARHGLRYFAFYGTLLGAIRHQDMIPWDDDIDVAMPREDYQKFIKLAPATIKAPLFLQTPESDRACFYGGYMKLRHSMSTAMDIRNWCNGSNQGVYIDIFPLDNFICNNPARKNNIQKIRKVQELLFAKIYGKIGFRDFNTMTEAQWMQNWREARFITKDKLYQLLRKYIQEGNDTPSQYYCIKSRYLKEEEYRFIRKEVFADRLEVPFGAHSIYIPALYKECLDITMGLDHMELLPPEQRKPHHQAVFSTRTAYGRYAERFLGALDIPSDKRIIIWGAGSVFADFMEKKGIKNPPSYVVDDDMAKWGSIRCNCMIESPDILLTMDKETIYLIICSKRYQMIEERLEQLGITEYYIYGSDKEKMINNL